jgi:hypothetical protein
MSSDIWQDANKFSTDTTFVVGWYHSHPDLGAFFSGTDRKTQQDFFNSAYNLGLVIDPIRNKEKWFLGANSIEIQSNKIRSIFKYGLRWYKRIRLPGGINVNLSKRGAGWSWGFGFFRLGVSATGRKWFAFGVPGTGLRYVKYLSSSNKANYKNQQINGEKYM